MSRPGGKKRGVKGSASGGGPNAKKVPFCCKHLPPVHTPTYREGMTVGQATAAWFAWLRIVSRLR